MPRTAAADPPVGAWRQPTTETLTPILAAALDAFSEVGFHGTTVRDIARRAGLTVPALYYHHENKEAVLASLLEQSIAMVIERAEAAVAEAGDDPLARFRNLVECLVLFMAQHAKSAAMDNEIRSLSPENRRAYSQRRRIVERLLRSCIDDGVAADVFSVAYPADTARALLGMVQAVTTWYRPGGRLSPQTLADRYVDIAVQAVGARPR